MKAGLKKLIFPTIAVFVILLSLVSFYIYKVNSEIKKMHSTSTQKITESIYCVNEVFVNTFFIKSNNYYIAIDAGNDPESLKKQMDTLNIDPKNVRFVLLTHTDRDHVGGLSLFPNATIYLSKEEVQMIDGKTSRVLAFKNRLNRTYKTINDNEVITFDHISIKGILCPGHTPGSMSFVVNDSCIFTGDALGLYSGKVSTFTKLFNMDTETQIKSISKVAMLGGIKHLYSAHHGYTDDFANAFLDWK